MVSENITHVSVVEDCFRLLLASDDICPPLKEAAGAGVRFANIASVTRNGDRFTSGLLLKLRAAWPDRRETDRLEQKLAFVLGWLCHRAADREMKPVFRAAEPDRDYSPSDCSIYNDAFVYRRLYKTMPGSAYSDAVFETNMDSSPAAACFDIPAVALALKSAMQRELLGLHRFVRAEADMNVWLDRLQDGLQRFEVDIARYAQAIFDPDPDKEERFIARTRFYDERDAVLRLTERLRRGEPIAADELRAALVEPTDSPYAQIIRTAFGYLRTASEFFAGDMTEEELRDRLDIGRRGRDGRFV